MSEEDYKEYANIITKKLDNTNEYALWLAIQCYVDEMYITLECAKAGLNKEKCIKEKSLQALNEIKEYVNQSCDFNGTAFYDKWVPGKKILEIIEEVN